MSADIRGFVETVLGHSPRDLDLFEMALTHSSVGNDSYERLEFLGDRVLGVVTARTLYDRYPREAEGNMTATRKDGHTGLGTKLVESFARQLGAQHKVTSTDEGTTHRLVIPNLD